MSNYGILLVVVEPAHREILKALLLASGGTVDAVASVAAALDRVGDAPPGLILFDLEGADSAALVDRFRRAADGARFAPIVALAAADQVTPIAGADAILSKPVRAAELTAALRRWLGDERIAANSGAQAEKLAALLGAEQAAGMIGRFHASLADAVAQVDAGGDARAIGHRVGGLAGMLGFDVMRAAWLGIEEHGDVAWPTVRALTIEMIEHHNGLSVRP